MPPLVAPVLAPGAFGRSPQPVLDAGGLTLRPWRPGDAGDVVAAYADPAIQRWHGQTMTDAEARRWIGSMAERWREETGAGWAIVDGDQIMGRIGFGRVDLAQACAEVVYWVVAAARGRGVAPRALEAMTEWAAGVGLHRLGLTHAVENEASCRVATRCGYTLEGTMRREARHADGWHDMHLHARLLD